MAKIEAAIREAVARGPPHLSPAAAAERIAAGAILIDVRPTAAFSAAHPADALHVPLDGQYASWVGTLIGPEQEIEWPSSSALDSPRASSGPFGRGSP